MSNSLSAGFSQYWSRRMSRKHYQIDVFRGFASFEEQDKLTKGDRVHRPYRSDLNVVSYVRGTSVNLQDLTDTDEYLLVDQAKIVPFYVDDLDALQHNYKIQNEYADDAAVKLGNVIDGAVLAEVVNATSSVDDGTLGGTSGNPIVVTTSNVMQLFSNAGTKLDLLNIEQDNRFAVVSPQVYQKLWEYLAGKDMPKTYDIGRSGYVGDYAGFQIFKSNASYWTATLALATTPTNTDTVTINGVTFTFVSSIGSTAGNVLIDGSAANSNTHLAALINTPGTTTANGVALSAADQIKIGKISATAGATSTALVGKGIGYAQVSETLTDTTDGWTANKQIQHLMFGRKNATDIVIQKRPNVEVKEVPDKLGKNILPWTLYGIKTFKEGTDMLVDVKVKSSSF